LKGRLSAFGASLISEAFNCQSLRDGLRKFLTIRRVGNPVGLARIGKVASFDEDGGPLLGSKHAEEPRAPDTTIKMPIDLQQRAVQSNSQLQILSVERVIWKCHRRVINVPADDCGRD